MLFFISSAILSVCARHGEEFGVRLVLMTGPCAKALGIGALALLLVCPAGAHANTVSYTGEGTNLKPGQSKGLPVLMGFDLIGKNCPSGDLCFMGARIKNFDGVSYAFPNCRELLDSAFEFRDNSSTRVTKGKPHSFSFTGTSFQGDRVTIAGHFLKNGRSVKGWFTVNREGCSTGRLTWTASPD